IPEAINVDLIAESGIKASIDELLPKLPRQSIDEIIVSNPQAFFLEYAAPVLKPGGRIYINTTKRNPFGKLPNAETLEQLKLIVVQENAWGLLTIISSILCLGSFGNSSSIDALIPDSAIKSTLIASGI
ncbi:MAG: hypothetical protein ACKPH7_15025, partial [Planktothrix sp.]